MLRTHSYKKLNSVSAKTHSYRKISTRSVIGGQTTGAITDPYFSSVSSLFHFNGTNGSTTFTDQKPHTISVATGGGISSSDISISTAQSKFGGASLWHSSGSGLISSAADTAWDITGGDFTVENWIYLTSYNTAIYNGITVATNVNGVGGSGWTYGLSGNSGVDSILFFSFNAGAYTDQAYSASITGLVGLNTWHHIAISYVFSTKTYKFFLNGVQKGTASSAGAVPAGSLLSIGRYTQNTAYPGNYWNGYIDDLRITKGVSRYSSGFSVPTAAFPNS